MQIAPIRPYNMSQKQSQQNTNFNGVAFKINYSSEPILELIKKGEFDATDIITHKLKLDEGKHAYEIFDKKLEDCIKVKLKP